jgi:hypothetical protein
MKTQRLKGVLDTPTLIAAALYKGICRSILVDALNHHSVFISEALIADFLTATDAPTLSKKRDYLHSFIRAYADCAQVVSTKASSQNDSLPSDYHDIIQTVSPDFLVSAFLEGQTMKKFGKTMVLSPGDFAAILQINK